MTPRRRDLADATRRAVAAMTEMAAAFSRLDAAIIELNQTIIEDDPRRMERIRRRALKAIFRIQQRSRNTDYI